MGTAGSATGEDVRRYGRAVAALGEAARFGMHPSLTGIRALTETLGRPQDALRVVQVTGTNGKTSVTRMVAALLEAHGRTAGAYTSPHLVEYAERIETGGTPVSMGLFADAVEAALGAAGRIAAAQAEALGLAGDAPGASGQGDPVLGPAFTEFELLTAAALWALRESRVEWAVMEVGMGGRWDATSVTSPAVAVVTGVALDHTRHLGGTVEEIAEDKAHVIKEGSVAVLGPGTASVDAILQARAEAVGAPVVRVRDERDVAAPGPAAGEVTYGIAARPDSPGGLTVLSVRGVHAAYEGLELAAPAYQAPNAAVAVAAAEAALGEALDAAAAREALRLLAFPGRFQVLASDPWVVADGAHNAEAAATLAMALDETFGEDRPLAVLAVLDDKDAAGMVRALAGSVREFLVTASRSPRALAAPLLADLVECETGSTPRTVDSVAEAIAIGAGEGDVVVTGSLTTAGEALEWATGGV